jgi:hypothetical protein
MMRNYYLVVALICTLGQFPALLHADVFTIRPRDLNGGPISVSESDNIRVQAFKHRKAQGGVTLADPTTLSLSIVSPIVIFPKLTPVAGPPDPDRPLEFTITIDANDRALTGGLSKPERIFFLAFHRDGQITSVSSFLAVTPDNSGTNVIDIIVPHAMASAPAAMPNQSTCGCPSDNCPGCCCRKARRKCRCRCR